ncbi:MAG: nucleotidyltransferase family protein [Gemmataceae bacterium]
MAILAGGLGTRLRSALPDTPKVLAPVLSKPFLAHLLDLFEAAGFFDVVLLTGYRADLVHEAFGNRYGAVRLRYSVETAPLGTGGALRQAAPLFQTEHVLLVNGDSCCPADLAAFLEFHEERQADASLLLASVADAGRFGLVEVDQQARVRAFHEKTGQARPGLVNAGLYFLRRDLLADIPTERAVSLEREVLPGWLASQKVFGSITTAPLLDIGTPESYRAAEEFLTRLAVASAVH